MNENDLQVEDVLREIRERVLRENKVARLSMQYDGGGGGGDDGGGENESISPAGVMTPPKPEPFVRRLETNNPLWRIKTNLIAAERTRSSLPPVNTYRSGMVARAELWLKRQIKRATRWFTHEQVNFNSAVYESLMNVHGALVAQEETLLKLKLIQKQTRDQIEDLQIELPESVRKLLDEQQAIFTSLLSQREGPAATTPSPAPFPPLDFEKRLTELEQKFQIAAKT